MILSGSLQKDSCFHPKISAADRTRQAMAEKKKNENY
jgi:hypothetical protein